MNRQSRLQVLQRTPLNEIDGYSRTASGNYVNCTYVNKGKKYPYESRPKCLRSRPVTLVERLSPIQRLLRAKGME